VLEPISPEAETRLQMIAHDALSALINLSDNLAVAQHLIDHEFLVWLVSYTVVSQPT
jgi:hypothetical protein